MHEFNLSVKYSFDRHYKDFFDSSIGLFQQEVQHCLLKKFIMFYRMTLHIRVYILHQNC
jgi:hypothetical protein